MKTSCQHLPMPLELLFLKGLANHQYVTCTLRGIYIDGVWDISMATPQGIRGKKFKSPEAATAWCGQCDVVSREQALRCWGLRRGDTWFTLHYVLQNSVLEVSSTLSNSTSVVEEDSQQVEADSERFEYKFTATKLEVQLHPIAYSTPPRRRWKNAIVPKFTASEYWQELCVYNRKSVRENTDWGIISAVAMADTFGEKSSDISSHTRIPDLLEAVERWMRHRIKKFRRCKTHHGRRTSTTEEQTKQTEEEEEEEEETFSGSPTSDITKSFAPTSKPKRITKRITIPTEYIKRLLLENTSIRLIRDNPKRKGSKSHVRYESYKSARTLRQMLQLGAVTKDLKFDMERGYIQVTDSGSRKHAIRAPRLPSVSNMDKLSGILIPWYKEMWTQILKELHEMWGSMEDTGMPTSSMRKRIREFRLSYVRRLAQGVV